MPEMVREDTVVYETDIERDKFRYRIVEAARKLFEMHGAGGTTPPTSAIPIYTVPGKWEPVSGAWCGAS